VDEVIKIMSDYRINRSEYIEKAGESKKESFLFHEEKSIKEKKKSPRKIYKIPGLPFLCNINSCCH